MPSKKKTAAEKKAEEALAAAAEKETAAIVSDPAPEAVPRGAPMAQDGEEKEPVDTSKASEDGAPAPSGEDNVPSGETDVPQEPGGPPVPDGEAEPIPEEDPVIPEFHLTEEPQPDGVEGPPSDGEPAATPGSEVGSDGSGEAVEEAGGDGAGPGLTETSEESDKDGEGTPDPTGGDEGVPGMVESDDPPAVPTPKEKTIKKSKAPAKKGGQAAAARTPEVAERKGSLRAQNVRAMDRDLTPEERKEWEAIYASYTSKSILTGAVQGVDMNTFTIRNAEGLLETKKMASAVVISHRVKVLIPELEFSMPDKLLPESVVHYLDQCSIDYVIISVDREHNLAIGSRRLAMSARRRYFRTAPRGHEVGEELVCRVLSVGPTRCTVECNGYDQEMRAADMSYNYIEDLREEFRPGDELRCRLVSYGAKSGLKVSVKEAQHHPFDGAVERHPIGSRRHATITNKDSGAVYCLLSDDVSCVCRYTSQLNDADFEIGDTVTIVVDSYYLEGKMLRGKILRKW